MRVIFFPLSKIVNKYLFNYVRMNIQKRWLTYLWEIFGGSILGIKTNAKVYMQSRLRFIKLSYEQFIKFEETRYSKLKQREWEVLDL